MNLQNLEIFKNLHQADTPLLLGNIWDAYTAKLAEAAGYPALGTSSHAIAFSLGYEDGEKISFEELFFVVKRILNTAKIPVSVDFEAGYSDDPVQVAKYAQQLWEAGAVGINLEDGKVVKGKRQLGDAQLLTDKIKAIKAACPIFINARIDTYTTQHENALEETLKRAKLYQESGADGIFVPLMEKEGDLKTFTQEILLPLNVFASSTLLSYPRLSELNVKRISHGAKNYEKVMKITKERFQTFLDSHDYNDIL